MAISETIVVSGLVSSVLVKRLAEKNVSVNHSLCGCCVSCDVCRVSCDCVVQCALISISSVCRGCVGSKRFIAVQPDLKYISFDW